MAGTPVVANRWWGVYLSLQDDDSIHVGTGRLDNTDAPLGATLDADDIDELIYQLMKLRRKMRRRHAKSGPGP